MLYYYYDMPVIVLDILIFLFICVIIVCFVITYLHQRKGNTLLRDQNDLLRQQNDELRDQNDELRHIPMPNILPASTQEEPEWAKRLYDDLNKEEKNDLIAEDAVRYVENLFLPPENHGEQKK